MKKFIAAILAICIISGITVISYAESYYGDLDGNGTVNSADALAILQYTVGLKKSIDTKAADVNHDGIVNSSDALSTLLVSVGKLFPEEITKNVPEKTFPSSESTSEKTTEQKLNNDYVYKRNELATVEFTGKPNTEYILNVYYSSGASKADGLGAKTTDSNGYVSWTWKIGGKTNPGTYHMTITGNGETIEKSFVILPE